MTRIVCLLEFVCPTYSLSERKIIGSVFLVRICNNWDFFPMIQTALESSEWIWILDHFMKTTIRCENILLFAGNIFFGQLLSTLKQPRQALIYDGQLSVLRKSNVSIPQLLAPQGWAMQYFFSFRNSLLPDHFILRTRSRYLGPTIEQQSCYIATASAATHRRPSLDANSMPSHG